ncbi:MAG TPA: T9SS type A sorting domain-containing protein [Chitinophagaceae bacterium]|nr:T9SS type A sorting domain-containing protein [Chitinophagaceae bacterium]
MHTCKHYLNAVLALGLLLPSTAVKAQICQHPTDSIYALSTTGTIYSVSVTNAQLGAVIPASSSTLTTSSNGLGYSSLNGKFYYFNKVGTGAAPSPQFVSYDRATSTLAILPSPPASITSTQKIRSGCVNHLGAGYYTINPIYNATTPALYFYSIATTSWSTITTSFVNPASVSLNSTFNSLNSGDMAFDGSGNLWILASNASTYALYKIAAPVPTSPVGSVTAIQVVAPTPTPAGVSITGLAFNAAGELYLSTGTGNNLLYKMTSSGYGLLLVGTLPINDVGADLTACSAPLFVLPTAALLGFTASLQNNSVAITWTAIDDASITGYIIETSTDAEHWTALAAVDKNQFAAGNNTAYHYTDRSYHTGRKYYRVLQLGADGKKTYSATRMVNANGSVLPGIAPNPASNTITLYNTAPNEQYLAQLFDHTGRLLITRKFNALQQQVDISQLPKGAYVLRLYAVGTGQASSHPFIKVQ